MDKSFPEPQIYMPETIGELLGLYKKYPHATIIAGGTYITRSDSNHYLNLPDPSIYIGNIDDLKRTTRTERYLEIGAAVTLKSVLAIGTILPPLLFEVISTIATPGTRNLATIGGNICVQQERLDIFIPLHLLDARLELRSQGNSRWTTCRQLLTTTGELSLQKSEVLTRVRVPFNAWSTFAYKKVGTQEDHPDCGLSFFALVKYQKNLLTDVRFGLGNKSTTVYRNKEIETNWSGKKIPLSQKDINQMEQETNQWLVSLNSLSEYQHNRAQAIFSWFFFYLRQHQPA